MSVFFVRVVIEKLVIYINILGNHMARETSITIFVRQLGEGKLMCSGLRRRSFGRKRRKAMFSIKKHELERARRALDATKRGLSRDWIANPVRSDFVDPGRDLFEF